MTQSNNKPAQVVEISVQNLPKTHEQILDLGKVRIGGMGPTFLSKQISDDGKVRVGGMGPIF